MITTEPRFIFHRDGRVEADRRWIGWLSRTVDGYHVETTMGRGLDLYGVSRPVAARTLHRMNEEDFAPRISGATETDIQEAYAWADSVLAQIAEDDTPR